MGVEIENAQREGYMCEHLLCLYSTAAYQTALYDDNFNADWINDYLKKMEGQIKTPDIKIVDFSFQGKILAFIVKDYLMRPADNNTVGRMKIRISLTNKADSSVVFDQEKVLTAQKAEMKISLGAFKTIKKGEYNFIINAIDLYTGKVDNLHKNIMVIQ